MMKRRWYEASPGGGFSLADQLGMPGSKQREIRQQPQSLQQQQAPLSSYWVAYLPRFSWSTFAGALYFCEEKAALQEAHRYIKREEGKLCAVMKLYSGIFVKW